MESNNMLSYQCETTIEKWKDHSHYMNNER